MSSSQSLRSNPTAASPPRLTKTKRKPVALAVTGGIGAGKSEMLRAFERHGAAVISSDEIVHRLLRDDADVKRAVVERFGDDVLDEDGRLDRGRIARVVFSDWQELAWLETLLHPLVVATYLRWREKLAESETPPAVCVTEVPLLYEVGGETRFDGVVAVTASPDVRVARHIRPPDDREARLIPDAEKLERADYAYVNDGTREELDRFVSDLMDKLTGP
jgi:dephospho-CoA kinase